MFDFETIPSKILKINEKILEFPPERRINICEACRNKNGDFKKYSPYIEDTGICNNCGITNDLINYSIVELVKNSGLTPEQFYDYYDEETKETHNGLRIIVKEKNPEIHIESSKEIQLDFLRRSIKFVETETSSNLFDFREEFRKEFQIHFKRDFHDFKYDNLFLVFTRIYGPGKEEYLPEAKKFLKLLEKYDYEDAHEILYPFIKRKKMFEDLKLQFPIFFKIKK